MKKKVLGIASVLIASAISWAAISKSETTTVSGGVATASDPSGTALGIDIGRTTGFRLTICAASGQTLSGGGEVKIWLYNSQATLWADNPSLKRSVTSSKRCEAFPDFDSSKIPINSSRVYAQPNGVSVSGGASVTVYYDACQTTGC